ncbi:MAG: M20 family metallopeptidase [Deinococcus sp.]|nr:M20 family metallopeptidase [Deinococcus sp.]
MAGLLEYLEQRTPDMVRLLQSWVEAESPSDDKAAVDRFAALVAAELERAGAQVAVLPQAKRGNHLLAKIGKGQQQLLVLGHMDTVWPLGTVAGPLPLRIADGKLFGPGSFDMKGGLVQIVAALWAVRDLRLELSRKIVILFNSDEEVGSTTSQQSIEDQARQSRYALVLEPAMPPNGALKTARKGVGEFELRITGRAAHAGADPKGGLSAIEELARQVQYLHSLTDFECGTTVNVGVVSGGTRSNVIAAEARAQVDLRVATLAEAERVVPLILGTKSFTGAQVEVRGGLNRPPLERTQKIVAAFQKAQALAAELGFQVDEAATGGGSDGNFTAALGVPTIDGLGPVGDKAHALGEHVVVSELPRRAALLVRLWQQL